MVMELDEVKLFFWSCACMWLVYMCMCVHICICVCACGVRRSISVSFLMTFYFIDWARGTHWTEPVMLASLATQLSLGSLSLPPKHWLAVFYVHVGDPNCGLHTSYSVTLPSELSPQHLMNLWELGKHQRTVLTVAGDGILPHSGLGSHCSHFSELELFLCGIS